MSVEDGIKCINFSTIFPINLKKRDIETWKKTNFVQKLFFNQADIFGLNIKF